jgi:prolyl-tRNA editing enzyme YbaK/EbsC (Cys-tRNA(Pro) deacylase)
VHPNVAKVRAALSERGFDAHPVEFAESTRTSAEAAAAVGTTLGQIAKSLVFDAGGEPVLVIASGANRVSTAKVAALLGAKVSRADAELVRGATGFPIGGVPPVAHAQPLRILIDEDLLAFDGIWASAGTPNAVFPIPPQDLVRVTGGTVSDVREV